jgi:hypothetical protein
MEVDTDIVTFIGSDLRTGATYCYFESDTGVAACVFGERVYSVRLKGGFYASGLEESEALRLLTAHSPLPTGLVPPDGSS